MFLYVLAEFVCCATISLKCISLKGTKCKKRKRRNNIYYPCCWISNILSFVRTKTDIFRDKVDKIGTYMLDTFNNASLDVNFISRSGFDSIFDVYVNRTGDFTRQWETRETVGFIEPLRVRESLTRRVCCESGVVARMTSLSVATF